MDTRKITAEYRLAQWSEIMQKRVDRGQSIKAFCEEENIKRNTYFYWQRKLREMAHTVMVEQPEATRGLAPSGWTQLRTIEAPRTEESGIVIAVNGYQISVNMQMDENLLRRVCSTLKSL